MNTKSISAYLNRYEEEIPEWIMAYPRITGLTFAQVMSERTGYYPGSGYDGRLVKVCNVSRSVHSFLHADYMLRKQELIDQLAQPDCFLGYHSIGKIEWEEKDLMPHGQHPPFLPQKPRHGNPCDFAQKDERPYCFTEIMERDEDRKDEWGAERFAITFLFADGIATYYQLFCMEHRKAPWIVLLQDHSFGGNYDQFGKGGLLEAYMRHFQIRPEFVLCDDIGTKVWSGYEQVQGLSPFEDRRHGPMNLFHISDKTSDCQSRH